MKFSAASFMALTTALTPAAAAAPDKCTPGQLEKVVTILSTSSKSHVRDCQAASGGFSIFPPAAKPPTDDQVKLMCASSACLGLISDVLDAKLVDCTLVWNGKTLNPSEMASSFQALCDLLNQNAGSQSVDWEHIRVRRERDASSGSSGVEAGVIETYRPKRARVKKYTPHAPHQNGYINEEYATDELETPQSEQYAPPAPEKPRPEQSVAHKPDRNWSVREMRETSDYKNERAEYELVGEDTDYTAPTDEYDEYAPGEDTDYEPGQYTRDIPGEDTDYEAVGKQ